MKDFGRQTGFERSHRGGALAVAKDVMDGNVAAAAHDELLAAVVGHEGEVGEAAL